MGNKVSVESSLPKTPKYGSVNDPGTPRDGYYYNPSKNTIKYRGNDIPILPGETEFKKLKYGYAKTNKRVFYQGKVIPNANPLTFDVVTRDSLKLMSKLNEVNLTKLNSVLGMDKFNNKTRLYHKGVRVLMNE